MIRDENDSSVVVCGLWSDDEDVAFGAACHVPERMLDLRDIDRYVAVPPR